MFFHPTPYKSIFTEIHAVFVEILIFPECTLLMCRKIGVVSQWILTNSTNWRLKLRSYWMNPIVNNNLLSDFQLCSLIQSYFLYDGAKMVLFRRPLRDANRDTSAVFADFDCICILTWVPMRIVTVALVRWCVAFDFDVWGQLLYCLVAVGKTWNQPISSNIGAVWGLSSNPICCMHKIKAVHDLLCSFRRLGDSCGRFRYS